MVKPEVPEDVPKLFVEYWNDRRADLIASLFEADADFVNVTGLWWTTRENIFKAHEYGLRVIFKDSRLSIIRLTTKMLTETTAVVHSKMKLEHQTPLDREQVGVRRTVFSFVVRKNNDGIWRVASAQNTDIVSGAETYLRTTDGKLVPANYRNK